MKSNVKWILAVIIIVGAAAAGIYTMSRPLAVETTQVLPQTAELYFIEQGINKPDETVQVYSLLGGVIESLEVAEKQQVRAGDVICVLDSSDYEYQLREAEAGVKGYEAQIGNLSMTEQKEKDSLVASRDNLQAQLKTIESQKNESGATLAEQRRLREEQIRMQNILIQENQKEIERARENLNKAQTLYNESIAARSNIEEYRVEVEQAGSDIERNNLARAREDLEKATILYENGVISQHDFDQSKIAVEQAEEAIRQSDLNKAKENLEKAQSLYEQSEVGESDVTQAKTALEQAEARLAQNMQQLALIQNPDAQNQADYFEKMRESINTQIGGVNTALNKSYTGSMAAYYTALMESGKANVDMLRKKISDCTIKSPATGTISKLFLKDSNVVNPQMPLVEIKTEKSGNVEVYISTGDIEEVSLGDSVELILRRRDGDKTIAGTVTEIDDEAEVKLSALGVEERKIKITVEPEPNDLLKAGYDVDVKFTFYREENKLTVPKTALFSVDDKDMVWVVHDGVLSMAEVVKGMELRAETVIESGITQGDYVITDANVDGLKKGAKVKIE